MRASEIIAQLVSKLRLPKSVLSTALLLNGALRRQAPLPEGDVALLALFLGCKFEDIHGHLSQIIQYAVEMAHKLDGNCTLRSKEDVVAHEMDLLGFLQFNFDFPSVYRKLEAVRIVAKDGGMEVAGRWPDLMERVNRIVSSDEASEKIGRCVVEDRPGLNRLLNLYAYIAVFREYHAGICSVLRLEEEFFDKEGGGAIALAYGGAPPGLQ